jgi:hypothetical protein
MAVLVAAVTWLVATFAFFFRFVEAGTWTDRWRTHGA